MVDSAHDLETVLNRFSAATASWFRGAFAAPTPAQVGSWEAISSGAHTLVVAPTGSGKTLSAFLWALDRLVATPPPEDPLQRCRVLYVSPMKALAVDVERNLRAPLVGIGHEAERLGLPRPDVRVAIRSGDTSAQERRAFTRAPADILITTPESLFLLLTSRARESLRGVETVILDEVHAVAGTKRGAHLAVSLDRLDHLLDTPAQRIGLSATVRPLEEVSRYLTGGRPVTTVQPPSSKAWVLDVVVPVPDLAELGQPTDDLTGAAAGDPRRTSIWPHVEERLVDHIAAHRSTLVFANSRRLAERLTARLNEVWEERLLVAQEAAGATDEPSTPARTPPRWALASPENAAAGAPAVLARAHHGSVSKEQRAVIEDDLKAGRLPAVVATSSLELGIDMGAVDLVIQVESPPSVASGLQRVGRAGHQVGAVSHGVLFPKHRGDLVQTAVVVEQMRAGGIEALQVPANPLDVLAQQIVAMTALDEWAVDDLFALVRRSASYATLTRPVFESVLDMLSGRYPSDEFAELRPRLVWDRVAGALTGRPGAQRLAVTSGGTIPDRGLYGVFLAGEGVGRRVGELDEEMVYESRVGDVFTLGTSSWRIEDITHDQVLVTPAPGVPGKLPFWKGDSLGRPAELGAAVGAYTRELVALRRDRAVARAKRGGLDDWAADNLVAYLSEQREATGHVPDDLSIVVERFRDELGDWQVVIHSPYGSAVHAPWALVIASRLRERLGVDVQAMHGDDGIVLRLPDVELDEDGEALDLAGTLTVDPSEVADLVTEQIGGSALFAARFRECAARALLLPRRNPGRRQALWQQRQRSAQLLSVASQYPSFPIVLEAVRECVQDVFDVPALTDLMARIARREIAVHTIETPTPSPYARSLLFGYVAQFLYEGDSPLAERRAAALSLDPELLAELLGRGDGAALADLLDPGVVGSTEAELQRLAPDRRVRDAEGVADLVRRIGPIATAEVRARVVDAAAEQAGDWLVGLEKARRLIRVRVGGTERWAAVEDAGRLRDALGVALPVGIPEALLAPVADPLGDLAARFARTHAPFAAADLADWLGVGRAVASDALDRLVSAGRLTSGRLRPLGSSQAAPGVGGFDDLSDARADPGDRRADIAHRRGSGTTSVALDYCDPEVLRLLRRRSLALLRAEVEPSPQIDLARLLPAWQGVGGRSRGPAAVGRAVEQLAGVALPASAWESLVLPARVRDYTPADLDELLAAGEVMWQGRGALPGHDGWVSLHLADSAPLTLAEPTAGGPAGPAGSGEPGGRVGPGVPGGRVGPGAPGQPDEGSAPDDADGVTAALMAHLAGGGAYHFRSLVDAGGVDDATTLAALWDLVWAGLVSNDTFAPVRALAGSGRGAHRSRRTPPRTGRYAGRGLGALGGRRPGGSALIALRSAPPTAVGRWAALPRPDPDPTARAYATAELLLDRYGVLTRGSVQAEDVPGGFAGVYRVLAAAEDAGRVRRGYFVDGLGAAQFASTGAVDRLRALRRGPDELTDADAPALVLAATDPANPYGAALPWPDREVIDPTGTVERGAGHRAARKAGALVVLREGELVLYVERGGRTLLCYSEDPPTLAGAAEALAQAVHSGALGRLTVEKADGAAILGSDHPLITALAGAGFHTTPRGLRLRR
ncbi:MAG: DEAD/DEAH box helicase [Austwickia sp.]|nr:DEAD/DEAH box helicase [Actinomycetota bacterium]MCO5308647.1 DEAD/DEAH box helicase [Austwickia sp.]